jgi:hypothetical protein
MPRDRQYSLPRSVRQLINDFEPPVASAAAARQRAAMPFVHLERELWDLRDAAGEEVVPDAPEWRAWPTIRRVIGYCPQGRAAGFLHRPSETTVVTEHHGSVEAIGEYVNQRVCR